MMKGVVSPSCEAMIRFAIGNKQGQLQTIDAVIDTGYTGFLSVPSEVIVALSLSWTGVDRVTLGDGSETTFEVYAGRIIWDGKYRDIPINESETEPLVGMSLLYGYDLRIQTVIGGTVTIEELR
ncbi:MAG: clan AA aspartic protease [Oculatellaceae cyanobacterium Prado106]|jgi:clan AA aspartic protease|nr:clan AA aspartic protease [Oculatellaceae cyanobacterium Prado106]